MKRTRQISLKECYTILGLKKGATREDLKRVYRQRAFELHPDLNPDKPTAARQFQTLNEAYVVLLHVLPAAPETPETGSATKQEPAQERARDVPPEHTQEPQPEPEPASQDQDSESRAFAEEQRRAAQAYAQEDILRDLLNDPFARRVFEDIYSEIHKQDPAPPQASPASSILSHDKTASAPASASGPASIGVQPEAKSRKIHMEWGKHSLNLDFSKGMKGAVKGWLRQQIDEKQSFKLPAASLIPGARIRLQIRRGLSDELSSVEITLPKDFIVGKPVRLRGLGKKIGPWQGDLYLTLEVK